MKKLKEKIFKLQKRLADGKLVKNPNPKGRKEMVTEEYAAQFNPAYGETKPHLSLNEMLKLPHTEHERLAKIHFQHGRDAKQKGDKENSSRHGLAYLLHSQLANKTNPETIEKNKQKAETIKKMYLYPEQGETEAKKYLEQEKSLKSLQKYHNRLSGEPDDKIVQISDFIKN